MVIVTDKEYYMDGYLQRALDKVKKMQKKDWDIVIVVDGLERAGKSVLAQQVAYYLDKTLTLDRITFTPEEFKKEITKAKKGQAIILDEAITGLFSRQAMSQTNISLVKSFAQCGQKNLVLVVVLPSFFILDSYIAIHRSRVLLHVYTKKLQRGRFTFFNVKRKKTLFLFGRKGYSYGVTKSNFRGSFTNFYVVNEKEYRAKKMKTMSAEILTPRQKKYVTQRNKGIIHDVKKLKMKQKDVAKIYGMSARSVSDVITEAK